MSVLAKAGILQESSPPAHRPPTRRDGTELGKLIRRMPAGTWFEWPYSENAASVVRTARHQGYSIATTYMHPDKKGIMVVFAGEKPVDIEECCRITIHSEAPPSPAPLKVRGPGNGVIECEYIKALLKCASGEWFLVPRDRWGKVQHNMYKHQRVNGVRFHSFYIATGERCVIREPDAGSAKPKEPAPAGGAA